MPAPDGYPIKLVRDRTASILNPSGVPGELFYGPLPEGASRALWLRKKLGEELVEYLVEPGAEELSDLLGVVKALADEHGVDVEAVLAADERGGFGSATMMYGRHVEFDGGGEARVGRPGAAVEAEALARRFHETYEALAPKHGYSTRPESRTAWEELPATNRELMIETCSVVLADLIEELARREQRVREALIGGAEAVRLVADSLSGGGRS